MTPSVGSHLSGVVMKGLFQGQGAEASQQRLYTATGKRISRVASDARL